MAGAAAAAAQGAGGVAAASGGGGLRGQVEQLHMHQPVHVSQVIFCGCRKPGFMIKGWRACGEGARPWPWGVFHVSCFWSDLRKKNILLIYTFCLSPPHCPSKLSGPAPGQARPPPSNVINPLLYSIPLTPFREAVLNLKNDWGAFASRYFSQVETSVRSKFWGRDANEGLGLHARGLFLVEGRALYARTTSVMSQASGFGNSCQTMIREWDWLGRDLARALNAGLAPA